MNMYPPTLALATPTWSTLTTLWLRFIPTADSGQRCLLVNIHRLLPYTQSDPGMIFDGF